MKPDDEAQRGAATLLLVAVVGLCVLLTAAGLGITRVALARVRVSSAADLAALAAAAGLDCGAAREVARANGTYLQDCVLDGMDAQVRVGLEFPVAGRRIDVSAEARAGPP